MTNGELYELAGRTAALRGFVNWKRRKHPAEETVIYGSEIAALMGWEGCCQKCGHPANDEDLEDHGE